MCRVLYGNGIEAKARGGMDRPAPVTSRFAIGLPAITKQRLRPVADGCEDAEDPAAFTRDCAGQTAEPQDRDLFGPAGVLCLPRGRRSRNASTHRIP